MTKRKDTETAQSVRKKLLNEITNSSLVNAKRIIDSDMMNFFDTRKERGILFYELIDNIHTDDLDVIDFNTEEGEKAMYVYHRFSGKLTLNWKMLKLFLRDKHLLEMYIADNVQTKNLFKNIKNGGKWFHVTPMLAAVRTGNLETVKKIHRLGGEINNSKKLDDVASPLMSSSPYPDIVKYLLDNGADVNYSYEIEQGLKRGIDDDTKTVFSKFIGEKSPNKEKSIMMLINHPDFEIKEEHFEALDMRINDSNKELFSEIYKILLGLL